MDEEKHFPPGAEPATPAKETEIPAPEAEPAAEPKVEIPEKAEAPKPEEKTPELPKKPRSIYDDYKEKKQEAKDASEQAAAEKARADAAEAKAAELQALLDKKDDATTPEAKAKVDDEIAAFAEEEGLKPEQIGKLADIIAKRITPTSPNGMTPEELDEWRASRATAKQAEEDQQILTHAPTVKTELGISDDTELANVMKEIVRLAHTPKFHDKEVEYIVWSNKDALSKLVSPKKPSAESGTRSQAEGSAEEVDFSSGKITPMQAQQAMQSPRSSFEVRKRQ